MINFEIQFTCDAINYNARASKIGGGIPQFNVSDIKPERKGIYDGFLFSYNHNYKRWEYGLSNPDNHAFIGQMWQAISQYCSDNNIQIVF